VQTALDDLLFAVRESVPSPSHITVLATDASGFTIQLGRSHSATITVTLHDSTRPSFTVTYPALIRARDGAESICEQTAEGILSPGVSWIVRKVFRFGFVPLEGYRAPHSNSGRPEQP
jgi:hypothetical protein